jgi:hypothetical protein
MYYTRFSITDNIHVITFVELCLTLNGTHMNEDKTEINWQTNKLQKEQQNMKIKYKVT